MTWSDLLLIQRSLEGRGSGEGEINRVFPFVIAGVPILFGVQVVDVSIYRLRNCPQSAYIFGLVILHARWMSLSRKSGGMVDSLMSWLCAAMGSAHLAYAFFCSRIRADGGDVEMDVIIRKEEEKDYRAVEELTREAFWNLYVPGCHEHFVLHNLRQSADFIPELDLVAEKEGQIAGHIVYCRGVIKDNKSGEKEVIGFGPVSVLPRFQKQGIGSSLINHSIRASRDMGYPAICIYGAPRYYSRFGFRCGEKYDIKTADDKFAFALLVLELKKGALNNMAGRFVESAAYEVDENKFAAYDAAFPFKEKAETESQREFRILAGLRY